MERSETDEIDRRSRLVSLVYEVLRDLKPPADATDSEILSVLSQAFLAKMTAPAEPAPPTAHEDRLSPMFLIPAGEKVDRRHYRRSSH
jgi:hypothetical protein